MDKIDVKRATKENLFEINKLLFQVASVHSSVRPDLFKKGAKKYDDKELEKILSDDSTPVFVVELNGSVVGYAFCVLKDYNGDKLMNDFKTVYIDDLCVDESFRRKGIGKILYDYVLNFATINGFNSVTLNVWADNKNALKFYESLGMRIQKIGMEKIIKN